MNYYQTLWFTSENTIISFLLQKRDLGDCYKKWKPFSFFIGFEERHSSRSDGEAIAMERFDQSEDNGELQPEEDQLFDETSLKEWN